MKRKWLILGTAGALLLTLIPITLFLAGVITFPNDDQTQPVAKITEPTGLLIDGAKSDGSAFYASLPNADDFYDFEKTVTVMDGAVWLVSADIQGTQILGSKVSLSVGDNVFYIGVLCGDRSKIYSVTLRRRPVFSVTFNSRGGSEVANEIIEEGFSVIKPADPTLKGYDFWCWNRDGTEYNFDSPVYSDLVLVAKWQPKTFTVSYRSKVGRIEVDCEQIPYNSWFVPPVPEDTDRFEFLGWYMGSEEIKPAVYDFECDITLTAKWISKEFEIENGVVTGFKQGFENLAVVDIPEENGILPVTAIAPRAFYYAHSVTSLTLPETLVSVGEEAFYGCGLLEKVVVQESASLYICGKNAFSKTKWLNSQNESAVYLGKCLVFVDKSVTEVEILAGTLGLADNLFEGSCVTGVSFPTGLLWIGDHCFEDSAISTAFLPESLVYLGEYAFYGCANLTTAEMFSPENVGAFVFYGCDKLTLTVHGQPKPVWHPLWEPDCKLIYA